LVLDQIKEHFAYHPLGSEILAQPFVSSNEKMLFMVVDPFKFDYSPAKLQVDSEEAQLYIEKF
jgi:hypothetical protein